ncbi:MAG: Pyruvate dehydrogenase (ubiquinone) [candidate division BRC1 bacterium ADurb.BinA364]|nr:MAG: Pyruvate dehydrogenase (ubiquinone) [candidate division BRC1 bacterium ADurb.BinA364]
MPEARGAVERAMRAMREREAPYAFVARKTAFAPRGAAAGSASPLMTRERAIGIAAGCLRENDAIVCTTGMASRELFELRERKSESHSHDFLTVGSMGHASQIALGLALARPERRVVCLDGDGAFLMHMGGAAAIGAQKPANFYHIVLSNGAHDSVGGQPTAAPDADIAAIAAKCGYRRATRANSPALLAEAIGQALSEPGPALIEALVKKGARADLGRPAISPAENKAAFMKALQSETLGI